MFTRDTMPNTWGEVPVGSEISEELYYDMFNLLPPIKLRKSHYPGFQCSEPYTHAEDDSGKWRSKHMTFVRIDGRFFYAGIHFAGECEWRKDE